MSKIIASSVIRGAGKIVTEAEELLNKTIKEKSAETKVEFPETAFYLPFAYAMLGLEVKTLGEMKPVIEEAKSLLPEVPGDKLWLPYLGNTLDSGMATLFAEECIMAIRYLEGSEPKEGYEGFLTDTWLRTLGIKLVDGRMPGATAILGAAPDNKTAVEIVRELQKRNILIFLTSGVNGKTLKDQLVEENVQMGWDNYIVPVGPDTVSVINVVNWAMRGALTFGGNKKGQWKECLRYCKERIFAFALVLGELDDLKWATGAGAINLGVCAIGDTKIPEIHPSGITTYEAVVKQMDHKKIVPTCIESRGVPVKIAEIPIPVSYSAAFEGETVRKEQMYVQFGGKYSTAFEYLRMKDGIEDGKIEVIGAEVDDMEEGSAHPLGILIEVSGRKMQKDFEPILERQIHTFLNEAMGIFHMGQRNMCWLRISKESKAKEFKLKHFGVILHARLHDTFGAIVDKAQITIYTKQKDVEKVMEEAVKAYASRDERMAGMTDESVDVFYSCTLCQSYAPNHVCIVKPERLGLCGAYTWLDTKASFELNPKGPNQPINKGRVIDQEKGQWEGVNEAIVKYSNRQLEKFNGYSIMDEPETSCGCFECIIAIIPETNGFMIVNREYPGDTPAGMKFTTLAGTVGGGQQTPGFMGIGRLYTTSKKFISADGGIKRIVWMTKELKESMGEKLKKRCEEEGVPGLIDKIADETTATSAEELLTYLQKVKHPVLEMGPLM
jgi:acetyl-CoA synthase